MSTRPLVTVGHPDFEETARVPASALRRMAAQGWVEVTDEQPSSADPTPDETSTETPKTPAKKAAKTPGQRATTTNKEH